MKVFLMDRNDVLVLQNNKRLKIGMENGKEFVEPQVDANGTAELQFVRQHELSSRWWWLSAILFWIVGLTGLFTPRYSTFYYSLNCNVRVSEQYDGVTLRFSKQYRNNRYNTASEVCVIGDGRAQISNGSYVYDEKAARRRKLYKVFSWFARIAVAVILVIVIIYRIVEGG